MADITNLQAIVARSSAKQSFALLLFSINDAKGAKRFLRSLLPKTPAGLPPETEGVPAFHFLFSWTGIEKLLDGHDSLDVREGRRAFETFFVDSAQAPDAPAMAAQLGFVGNSAPEHWWHEFKTNDIELAVYGAFDDAAQRNIYVQLLKSSASTCGLSERQIPSFAGGTIAGYRAPGGIIHFGYRDGLTTPDFDWTDSRRPGSVDMREIIVGYPNDDYPTAPFQPGPWRDFSREGSYACLTWISQDVPRFMGYLEENAPKIASLAGGANSKEWLAAKLVGRWRNGTPLALHDIDQSNPPDLNNNFGFADDPMGLKCPLNAHIRIANSRDQPLKFANKVRFPNGPPRLARRGFSYGQPWNGTANDDEDRGLVGLFLCARVNEQFYTVLRWMHRTDFSDVYQGIPNGIEAQDALVANHSDSTCNSTIHLKAKHGDAVDLGLSTFIKYRGVAALFAPSIRALSILADD